MLHSDLYACSANGEVQVRLMLGHFILILTRPQRWSASFDLTGSWSAHSGIVLSSIVTRLKVPRSDEPATGETGDASKEHERFVLVTGGNDDQIKVRVGLAQCARCLSCRAVDLGSEPAQTSTSYDGFKRDEHRRRGPIQRCVFRHHFSSMHSHRSMRRYNGLRAVQVRVHSERKQ